jgi:hypothetical protein
MEVESKAQSHAKLLNEKLQEIMNQPPFQPINKSDGVKGIIIIRLISDIEANVCMLGHIYPAVALEAVMAALAKGQQISEGADNPLAT